MIRVLVVHAIDELYGTRDGAASIHTMLCPQCHNTLQSDFCPPNGFTAA